MKDILLLLFVSTLLCVGIHASSGVDSVSFAETEYLRVETREMRADTLLPVEWDYPSGSVISTDAQSLTLQYNGGGRSFRYSFSKLLFYKWLVRAVAVRTSHQHAVGYAHTTVPYLNWEVASEHYIFGMRRILI